MLELMHISIHCLFICKVPRTLCYVLSPTPYHYFLEVNHGATFDDVAESRLKDNVSRGHGFGAERGGQCAGANLNEYTESIQKPKLQQQTTEVMFRLVTECWG